MKYLSSKIPLESNCLLNSKFKFKNCFRQIDNALKIRFFGESSEQLLENSDFRFGFLKDGFDKK